MKKLKDFTQFINEGNSMLSLLGAVLSGAVKIDGEGTVSTGTANTAGDNTMSTGGTYTPSGTYNAVQGNDDFALYMQHQQGVAGASGIVKALNGTGKMASDTIKTKRGVKYANLVQNIPSDRPQVKKDVIAALDAGDQKTAAALFLNVWKEKWFALQKSAKAAGALPKNVKAVNAIKAASTKYKVPFDFALTVAMIESSLNPKAGNSTYKGLFAMQPNSNYGGVVTPMGDKWSDPNVNADNGVKLLKDNIKVFKRTLGNDWASLKVGSWANNLA